jgi:hypothetical protein
MSPISTPSILKQLGKILTSCLIVNADQSRALLEFIVEQAVNQQTDRDKEYTVGAEALGPGPSFDPWTLAKVTVLMGLIGFIATLIPARGPLPWNRCRR